MRGVIAFLTACVLAAIAPAVSLRSAPPAASPSPDWPTEFEGRPLTATTITERESDFAGSMKGAIARFSDGQREIIIRHVTRPDRRLHPAADCFKGIGYQISPRPLFIDAANTAWGSFSATRDRQVLHVREQIRDLQGNTWPDVSSWYWSALTGRTQGPWWAFTVANPAER